MTVAKRHLLNAALLVASATITLTLAEIALRKVARRTEVAYGWGLKEKDLELALKTYHTQLAEARGTKQLRILLLGDSQVENRGTEPRVLPATILENELRHSLPASCGSIRHGDELDVMVFTLGRGGWGQDQQQLALEAVIGTVRPHLVLNWFTPENDLWNNAFPTSYGTPKPTFVPDNESFRLTSRQEIVPPWARWRLLVLAKIAVDGIERRLRRIPDTQVEFQSRFPFPFDPDRKWDLKYLPPVRTTPSSQNDDKDEYLSQFNPWFHHDPIDMEKSHFTIGMNPDSPRIDYMVRLTSFLIRKIQSTAEQFHSHYAAFYYSADNTNQPLYPPDGIYSARGYEFVFSHTEMQQRLAQIFHGVRLYPVQLVHDNWRRPPNDPHLTTSGNRHLMESLSRQLLENGFVCSLLPP